MLWVASGPSASYQPNGRYRGQSGHQKHLKYLILTSAFGRGCVKTRRISWPMGQRPILTTKALQMRLWFPISVSEKLESRCNLPPALLILRFYTASARSGQCSDLLGRIVIKLTQLDECQCLLDYVGRSHDKRMRMWQF